MKLSLDFESQSMADWNFWFR